MQTIDIQLTGTFKAKGNIDVVNPMVKIGIDSLVLCKAPKLIKYSVSFFSNQQNLDDGISFPLEKVNPGNGPIRRMGFTGEVKDSDVAIDLDSNWDLTQGCLDNLSPHIKSNLETALAE